MESETWPETDALTTFDANSLGERAVLSDAERTASTCICGLQLPVGGAGGRRLSCSPHCKARRDAVLRALARRRLWVRQWDGLRGGPDYSTREIDAAVAALADDIAELTRALHPQRGQEA